MFKIFYNISFLFFSLNKLIFLVKMNSVTSGHVFLLIVFHSSQKAVIGKSSTSHIPKLSQNKKPTIREMFKIHTKVD